MEKPSNRIKQLAEKYWKEGIDPGFSGGPQTQDYINAIVNFLDEEHEKAIQWKPKKLLKHLEK